MGWNARASDCARCSGSAQLDRLAVRGGPGGSVPVFHALLQIMTRDQLLRGDELFKRGKPVLEVMRAVIRFSARSRRRDWELSGRTSGNTVVNFAGRPEWIGTTVAVRITGANPNSLRGESVNS